jgi:hypothetical protein
MIVMTLFELLFYAINEYIVFVEFQANDVGGTRSGAAAQPKRATRKRKHTKQVGVGAVRSSRRQRQQKAGLEEDRRANDDDLTRKWTLQANEHALIDPLRKLYHRPDRQVSCGYVYAWITTPNQTTHHPGSIKNIRATRFNIHNGRVYFSREAATV